MLPGGWAATVWENRFDRLDALLDERVITAPLVLVWKATGVESYRC